jgi:hypothetical protein
VGGATLRGGLGRRTLLLYEVHDSPVFRNRET